MMVVFQRLAKSVNHNKKHITASFLLASLLIFAISACWNQQNFPQEDQQNNLISQIPNIEMTGYLLIRPDIPLIFSKDNNSKEADLKLEIASVELVYKENQIDNALKIMAENGSDAKLIAEKLKNPEIFGPWVQTNGLFVMQGNSNSPWAEKLQSVWLNDERASFRSRYPKAWELSLSLPRFNDRSLIGTGFVLNAQKDLSALLVDTDLDTEEFISAIQLLRLNTMVFSLYSDKASYVPISTISDIFDQNDLGVVLIAESDYPVILLNFFIDHFSGSYGVSKIETPSGSLYNLSLPNDYYLTFRIIDAKLYLYISDSYERSKKLTSLV